MPVCVCVCVAVVVRAALLLLLQMQFRYCVYVKRVRFLSLSFISSVETISWRRSNQQLMVVRLQSLCASKSHRVCCLLVGAHSYLCSLTTIHHHNFFSFFCLCFLYISVNLIFTQHTFVQKKKWTWNKQALCSCISPHWATHLLLIHKLLCIL